LKYLHNDSSLGGLDTATLSTINNKLFNSNGGVSASNQNKPQISENVQKVLSSTDLYLVNHSSLSGSLSSSFSSAVTSTAALSNSCVDSTGLCRQESRDSLIEVALDNTEQIVSKLLGKTSSSVRSILTSGANNFQKNSSVTASALGLDL
jgi:hypothetical protein